MAYLASNRILYEEWEDKQYKMHLRKVIKKIKNNEKNENYNFQLQDVKKRVYIDNTEPMRFPHLSNNAKRTQVS
jgi:hypothetical protein